MKRLFLVIFSITSLALAKVQGENIEQEVGYALELLKTDLDSCKTFSSLLLDKSRRLEDQYGLVKSNFILGYIEKKQGNFGKSIIYYLEALRHAKNSDYKDSRKDLVNLLQNTGNIFKQFGNYDLAKNYYEEAMDISYAANDLKKYAHIIFLTSLVLKEEENYDKAISLLESAFVHINDIKKSTVPNLYNQLGLIYTEKGDKKSAIENFNKMLKFVESDPKLKHKYSSWAYHNLGNLHFQFAEFHEAIDQFKLAIEYKLAIGAKDESIFLSYKDLSESYIRIDQFDSANKYLELAEALIEKSKNIAKHYELYKFQSIVHKAQGNLMGYSEYQDRYASSLEIYLEEQRQIEAADKKYNLDLITQRYFALVAEQERTQQIQYYSAVGGSFLVTLIVFIIAFYQYRKYRLRKDLEASLKPYIKDTL